MLEEHGSNQHAVALECYWAAGWRMAADDERRPAGAGRPDGAGAPGLADGRGPAATVTDGEDA